MGKPGRPHPSQGKSSWLLEDARQMEERLAELRLHMEKECAERQRTLEAGRVWASSDAPRPSVSKQHIAGRGNVTLESSLRQGALNRIMALGSQTQGRSSMPRSSQPVKSTPGPSQDLSTASQRAVNTPTCRRDMANHGSNCLAAGSFDEESSRQSFLAALDAWRGTAKHMNKSYPVDTASATDTQLDDAKSSKLSRSGASVFRRMVLMRALEKAGHAAAAECECRNGKVNSTQHSYAPIAAGSPRSITGHKRRPSCRETHTSQPPQAPEQRQCLKDGAERERRYVQCAGDLQSEDVVVISVTDVDPHEALTARTRLPDTIVLPP